METIATKYFAVMLLTIFGGGWTVPLGLPPAPEDPALARVAPEKCLFYVSWAGMAAADAKSKNKTEQLLAEPEVQRSFAALATLVSKTVLPDLTNSTEKAAIPAATPATPGAGAAVPPQPAATNDKEHDEAIRQIAMDFAQIVATHPAAVFVTEIKTDKDGNLQLAHGGMFVAAGADAEKLRAALEQFRKDAMGPTLAPAANVQPKPLNKTRLIVGKVQIAGHASYRFTDSRSPSMPPVTCGFRGTDFILGVGDGSVEEILKRRRQAPPAWLANLRKELPVERVSAVVYLNLKILLDQAAAGKAMPTTREALHRLGLDRLSALSSVSGLEGEAFTSKLLLSTDGEPQGPLLNLFSDRPLRASDLAPILRDATLALAMRFDAQKAVDQFATLVETLDPAQRTAVEGPLDALAKSLEVDPRRELPKALGDTCCIYSSPGEGGLVFLGLTAVVPIRNRDAVSVIQAKFLGSSLAKGFQGAFKRDPSPQLTLEPATRLQSCSFAGQRIFYFTGGMGIAPAWCATDRELIVAMTPQNVMAYLQHGAEHKSLATVSQVSHLIQSANAPSMLEYVDTAKLFELAYPFVPLMESEYVSGLGDEEQLPLDSIPSAPAIGRHLFPGTAALRRTKQGLELISRQPLPGTGLLWTAAVAMQVPQSLEQEVAAERQRRADADPFWGRTTVPAPATATPAGAPPMLGPAGTTYGPGPASLTAPVPTASAPAYSASPPGIGPPAIGPAPGADAYAVPLVQPALAHLFDIGAGVKAYRNKHRTMPPAYLADKQGKPLLSWRVALLPYLGRQDLYKRFHLNEPWDSPHNRQLIALIPEAYQDGPDATFIPYPMPVKSPPARDTAGKTRFLLLRGPKTVYATATPPMPGTYEEWLKIIVVRVVPDRAVPWTKPGDFTYDAKDPGAGIEWKSGAVLMMLEAGSVVPAFPFSNSADSSTVAKELERSELLRHFTGEQPTVAAPPHVYPPPTYAPAPTPQR